MFLSRNNFGDTSLRFANFLKRRNAVSETECVGLGHMSVYMYLEHAFSVTPEISDFPKGGQRLTPPYDLIFFPSPKNLAPKRRILKNPPVGISCHRF